MADSKFKIHKIKVDLDLSIHHFVQLQDNIQQKVEGKGLTTTMLATNNMRQNMQTIVDIIISRFKKMITSTNDNLFKMQFSGLYT